MNKYKYTQSWFSNSEMSKILFNVLDKTKKYNILEIGCFEGLSACFFSDNLLEHNESTLDCVDPFYISGSVSGITSKYITDETINIFKYNINSSNNSNKITFHNETSDTFFQKNTKTFNFIYVDGCHEQDYINRDIRNSFNALEIGGILWMDDYGGGNPPNNLCKTPIDKFVDEIKDKIEIIHKNYQFAFIKRSN
jgi:predicted O-methyltransferase YrrM